jgi:hypothetical protein
MDQEIDKTRLLARLRNELDAEWCSFYEFMLEPAPGEDVPRCDEKALKRWCMYNLENKLAWVYFERYSRELMVAGVEKTSARMIVERMRWEATLEQWVGHFKINNDYPALWSRLLIWKFKEEFPDRFFSFRKMKHERKLMDDAGQDDVVEPGVQQTMFDEDPGGHRDE